MKHFRSSQLRDMQGDCCLVGVGCDASMKGDSKKNHHLLLAGGLESSYPKSDSRGFLGPKTKTKI